MLIMMQEQTIEILKWAFKSGVDTPDRIAKMQFKPV
jgi:hypothetical protein